MKKNEGLDGDEAFELDLLQKVVKHPLSAKTDALFETVIPKDSPPPAWLSANTMTFANVNAAKELQSMKEKKDADEVTLDEGLEFDLGSLETPVEGSGTKDAEETAALNLDLDEGLDLSLGGADEISLGDSPDEGFSLGDADDGGLQLGSGDEGLGNVADMDFGNISLDGGDTETATATEVHSLEDNDFSLDTLPQQKKQETVTKMVNRKAEDAELSDDVRNKLKEIDAIMDSDSKININMPSNLLDEPLVADALSDDDLGFTSEPDEEVAATRVVKRPEPSEEKPKRKKKDNRDSGNEDIREISGAYSGELERLQATISNLRADRDELLTKIQVLEDEKVLHNRQSLTMRAELDERKIELSIIRRKLNDEIAELKDKMRVHEERRLILEEKNRLLQAELEKANQKNKLDVKKVQMRERELEQKLELLKADAETQIRHRDLKILELKRKIDAMEFDMESMNSLEKRSVESRFELEDKLEKAIRTLRSAITVLEDENDSKAIEALKKNIDI